MKKALSLILAVSLLIAVLPMNAFALKNEGSLKWPEMGRYTPTENYSDKYMFWYPPEDYTTAQNPPDFQWRPIVGADFYDIIVCSDKEMNDVKYSKYENINHYYNFSKPFEPGVYYWSVRYKKGSQYSVWHEPMRFRIDEQATEVEIFEPSVYIEMVSNLKRPMYYPIKEYKSLTEDEKQSYDSLYSSVMKNIEKNESIDTSYTYKYGDGGTALNNTFWKTLSKLWDYVIDCSSLYSQGKDETIKKFGIEKLMQICEFSYPPFDANTDTYTLETARALMIGYDTFYNVLTDSQRKTIIKTTETLVGMAMDRLMPKGKQSVYETNPSASHEWVLGLYMVNCAILAGDDANFSEEVINKLLGLYMGLADANCYEDGTYFAGIGYARYKSNLSEMSFIQRVTGAPLFEKAERTNAPYYFLYMWPTNEIGPFGDESLYKPDNYAANHMRSYISMLENPYSKWMYDQLPSATQTSATNSVAPKAPIDLPRSKYFPDGGFAGLHSDLIDSERISLYFRSSWWGSYGHAHADQNSFVINAYGEDLAIDSGFYPYFQSPHHKNYTRKSYAHNTITINGGKGQPGRDIESEGKITGFLSHTDFDFVSGDASKAYKTDILSSPATLDKFNREIIYIRPDTFIIIDDLKALDGETASFEFWLNAQEDVKLYKNANGAKITKGNAQLDATVVYPKKVTGRFIEGFAGPDLINYPREVNSDTKNTPAEDQTRQRRVYFATRPVSQTKMITTLDVHKSDYPAQYINQENGNGYIKLSFEDGTIAYIQTGDNTDITADNYIFNGSALVVKGESILSVNGTYVKKDSKPVIESDVPVTVAFGDSQLEISALTCDANVKIYSEITKVINIKDTLRREVIKDENKYGIKWTLSEDYSLFSLYNGYYSMYLNGRELPGDPVDDLSMTLIIDGKEQTVSVAGYYDHDKNIKGTASIPFVPGFYQVDKMDGVNLSLSEGVLKAPEILSASVIKDNAYLELKSVSESEVEFKDNFDAYREKADSWVEGEAFTEKIGASTIQREPVYVFLSNAAMLQNIQVIGEKATYELSASEAGNYDILISNVVYNTGIPADIMIKINGQVAVATFPVTNGPEGPNVEKGTSKWGVSPLDWHVGRIKCSLPLKKGKNTVEVIGLGGGNMKMDWIGIIKSEN